jgi:CDP-diacylglycerol--glycerol-3-phosphate 3-phosphatidyltransferase
MRQSIPNALSAIRLVGSPFLILAAWADSSELCLALFVLLWLTDWIDGKLAILLKQQSAFGARLDSIADATFYASSLIALAALKWEVIRDESAWLVAAVVTYAASLCAGWLRFGRLPSYHTRLAKMSWLLAGLAVIANFAGWSPWWLGVAAAAVTVTNLEALAITLVLPEWRVDVLSVFQALRQRRGLLQ